MNSAEARLRDVLGLKVPGEGRIDYSVKAGAGGGKTTLFSIRICAQILEGLPIEDFVIITYTNAAAAELREKVTARLQMVLDQGNLSEQETIYAREALASIELMQISTIHSFLLKLLKEYAFESNVVLNVRMLEDEEDQDRKSAFFNEWYRKHNSEIREYSKDWIHVMKTDGREQDMTHQVFKNMFMEMANIREEIVVDDQDHTADFDRMAKTYVEKWLPKLSLFKETLLANRPVTKTGTPVKLNKDPQAIVDLICEAENPSASNLDAACKTGNALKAIQKYYTSGKSFYGAKGDNSPLEDVIPELPEWGLEADFATLYEKFMLPSQKAAKVAAYVCTMQKEYQKMIDRETLELSNDDILYRSDCLLKNHPEILNTLRERYRRIYVDEFQDTTGLQARLVKMLSQIPGTDPADEKLEPGKLLVVGDPKQSIYRFTGAEKAVYDEVDSLMGGLDDSEAMSVFLDTNFRSNQDVVEWVNRSFKMLMPKGYSEMETEWKVQNQEALHGVYRYVPKLLLDDKGKEISYYQNQDVDAVVGLVERLVGNDYCFVEERDGSLRQIRYSDIMIICKNTTHMSGYVKKFAEQGIPVNVQGRFKINDDVILHNYVLLLDYFANHKDRKRKFTAMQIICGMDVAAADSEEITAAEAELDEMRRHFQDKGMNDAAITQYLLAREDLYLPKGQVQRVEAVRSYRIRLHQMVETCLMNNEGDLKSLVDLMLKYLETDVKREIPLESNENAIRLMNVHQSKGLTGQIVIIADRSAKEECRYSAFRKAGKYYPAAWYNFGPNSSRYSFPAFGCNLDVLREVYQDETEEAIRLQYVAATRAAHALIFMPVASKNHKEVWFTRKEYGYDGLPDVNDWLSKREEDTASYSLKTLVTELPHPVQKLSDLEENLKKAELEHLTGVQLTSITPSSLETEGVTGYWPEEPGYNKEKRPGGNVFGTVMHRVYELIFGNYERVCAARANGNEEKLVTRFINQAILEQKGELQDKDEPREFQTFLKGILMKYLDLVIDPVMETAEEIYPEYTFSFFIQGEEREAFLEQFGEFFRTAVEEIRVESEKIWINGQADLVVKQKDGSIKVYDYKSDAMNGKPREDFIESMEKKYAGQLALYRYAIGKTFGVDHVATELIHLYR